MSSTKDFNQLKNEDSAYLKQHQKNPVFWMPYGEEALLKAKNEDKPIFLSVGYSSCHWCHVMAEESFEDQKTAEFMNENFVNIKVDREEMPDLDQYYQTVCQLMNGRGGWPLSVFLTSDMKPFFAGTYFPKVAREKIPSFMDVLLHLAKAYREDKKTILSNAQQLTEAAKAPPKAKQKVQFEGRFPPAAAIINALKDLADKENGGYGKAPKFPQFRFYEFAVEQILEGMVPQELGEHIALSVEKMLMGGIYDQARGGVHRYSVDEKWLVPHFEKMLYDQAGLLKTLAKLSLIYPSPLILDAQIQTLRYLQNEMLSEKNFFFSAQDADSEGVEGLYFTFTKEEFADAVTKTDEETGERMEEVFSWFKFEEKGNFESGLNVVALNPEKKQEFFKPENWSLVRKIRAALLEERKTRIPPLTDNKGVASWNFMMNCALIDLVQYTKIESIRESASSLLQRVVEGTHKTFLDHGQEGEASRIKTSTTRELKHPLLEDYVFFSEFQLRLYEISGNEVFKQNGLQTLAQIKKMFFKDGHFYTRAIEEEENVEYDNIPAPVYDQSYRAPVGTYFFLVRKWSLLSSELKDIWDETQAEVEELKNISLQSPLGFGEVLRALIYPEEAFKQVKIPLEWLKENKIQPLFPYLSSRFILNYQGEQESWEICNSSACEATGKGFESFREIFIPKKEKGEATES